MKNDKVSTSFAFCIIPANNWWFVDLFHSIRALATRFSFSRIHLHCPFEGLLYSLPPLYCQIICEKTWISPLLNLPLAFSPNSVPDGIQPKQNNNGMVTKSQHSFQLMVLFTLLNQFPSQTKKPLVRLKLLFVTAHFSTVFASRINVRTLSGSHPSTHASYLRHSVVIQVPPEMQYRKYSSPISGHCSPVVRSQEL